LLHAAPGLISSADTGRTELSELYRQKATLWGAEWPRQPGSGGPRLPAPRRSSRLRVPLSCRRSCAPPGFSSPPPFFFFLFLQG